MSWAIRPGVGGKSRLIGPCCQITGADGAHQKLGTVDWEKSPGVSARHVGDLLVARPHPRRHLDERMGHTVIVHRLDQ